MVELTPDESRVLGVLIEKALTTPDQYPLSLNAITNGSNQKNNRDPVLTLTDDQCFAAAEGLRAKGLAVRVDAVGGRVHKYRHGAVDTLHVRTGEAAILAELLLRGPQTIGELRGRVSRMVPLESPDAVKELLRALSDRTEPLVKEVPPSPGSRAERYAQLLCPELHSIEGRPESGAPAGPATPSAPGLADRVAKLESEVAHLREVVRKLAAALGETDPFTTNPA
jgi:uncharacterized protein YceH (UPF0502 family)